MIMNFPGVSVVVVVLMLTAQAATAAQNPPDAPPPTIFRTGVQLVRVRVVAEDKDGKPVTDLHQEEFQLLDNGLSQDIRLFLNESERASSPLSPLPPSASSQTPRTPTPSCRI